MAAQKVNRDGFKPTFTKNWKGPKLQMFFISLHVSHPGMPEKQMLALHDETFQSYMKLKGFDTFDKVNELSRAPFPLT